MGASLKKIAIPEECPEIALCGGPYNNFASTKAFLDRTREIRHRFCLGDIGGFGPHPDRTLDLIRQSDIVCIQGNYDEAVGNAQAECGCGYLDPRDRHFAQLSFDYSLAHTSSEHRAWLRELPQQVELSWRGKRLLLCHGSPSQVNEFIWESETSEERIAGWLREFRVDGFCATHSGLPWIKHVPSAGFWMNVGVLGRPAHEGKRHVYFATIRFEGGRLLPKLEPLEYDPTPVIAAMREEKLPEEFCEALENGIWTTCFNILPPVEAKVKKRS